MGGGWAVRENEGQVRRRVVGEGLGEKMSFELFEMKSREIWQIREKSTVCYGFNLKNENFSAF